jgi:hypothetical protein
MCICCSRASTRRSRGSRKRAGPLLLHRSFRSRLAAAYALRGETERAATELAEDQRLSADGRCSSIAHLKAAAYFGAPKVGALFEANYFVGPRKAGMPEE